MKAAIVFALLFSVYVTGGEGVTCECSFAKCPVVTNSDCPRGVTQDICGCCSVCAGDVGEHCGGPWGIFGSCGNSLECKQKPCPSDVSQVDCYMYYLTDPGTCVEKKHHSLVDILQGTHLQDASESAMERRMQLIKELQAIKKK